MGLGGTGTTWLAHLIIVLLLQLCSLALLTEAALLTGLYAPGLMLKQPAWIVSHRRARGTCQQRLDAFHNEGEYGEVKVCSWSTVLPCVLLCSGVAQMPKPAGQQQQHVGGPQPPPRGGGHTPKGHGHPEGREHMGAGEANNVAGSVAVAAAPHARPTCTVHIACNMHSLLAPC